MLNKKKLYLLIGIGVLLIAIVVFSNLSDVTMAKCSLQDWAMVPIIKLVLSKEK